MKNTLSPLLLCTVTFGFGACSKLPLPPTALHAAAGNSSANITFTSALLDGGSPVESYLVRCTAGADSKTASTRASPVRVSGLANDTPYVCEVWASNSAGTSAASQPVEVTPVADAAHSLAAVYKQARWAKNMSVTFPDACSMTLWSDGQPNHPVDTHYLTPPTGSSSAVVARTPMSGIQLAVTPYKASIGQEPIVFNVCPVKGVATTATRRGVIGIMISGASLFASTEIEGHRATVLSDNVVRTFNAASGKQQTARFIDECNGHPNPSLIGSTYHYHGLSECVTSQIDAPGGPSHLIGVALDGFPIYGDRDIDGKPIDVSTLDACNGITSATPEFPQGTYHYVLPRGAKGYNSAMRCYAGTVTPKQLAAAQDGAFCYTPDNDVLMSSRMPNMAMTPRPNVSTTAKVP